MLRTLTLLTLSSAFLFASHNFTVRLAAFTSADKLSQALSAYPPALQKTISTYKKGKYIYAYTLPTEDKVTLKKLLPSYRTVFKDAYISPTRLRKGQLQR